jgi:hypothetical protein
MIRAVEKIRERVIRAAETLESEKIPYAVSGDMAVAEWVSRVDESAVRNSRDVEILLRRADFRVAQSLLNAAGIELFLGDASASARDAVHVVFASEKVRQDSVAASPDISESEEADQFRVVTLEALVRMKLAAFRDKDRTHLRDLIEVGLVDRSFLEKLSPELRSRLQIIFDTPEG